MPWPWLIAEIPAMPDDWAQAFDEAMRDIARLHLPPQFRVIRVFEALGTLRIEWRHAGAIDNDVARIALKLAIRTDSWCMDPNDTSF
ncbi:hypothetical protein [Magnetospirillum sulfuroxidans]|uniref:Uncharacterized protein n=1 Tax=Magnetospirillum sulfuroxidans TaxID=611300 RepID=A0ABS5IAW5_9PROT|nr:hypothetical protein [Magnetospirillum sulfuroxidans]MBR9971571.1 hypothetical protein [Magnetospirillum sulfuroxidans]